MNNLRVAILGLLCLGAAIAHNCEQLGHSPSDHTGAASQQSFSSASNYVSAGQGGQSVSSFGGSVNGVPFGGTFSSNNGHVSGVTHGINGNSNTGFGISSGGHTSDQLYNPGNLKNDLPEDTPYWWMNDQSPFKQENSLKGCNPSKGCNSASSNDVHSQGPYIKMDLSQNPFINGNYHQSDSSSSVSHSGQDGHNSVTNQEINLSNNPFIGGQSKPTHTGHTSNTLTHSGSGTYNTGTTASKPIDLAGNPFLNGGSSNQHSGSASTNLGSLTHTQTTGSGGQFSSGSNQYSGSSSPGSVTHTHTQTTGPGAYNSDLSGNPFLNKESGHQSTGSGSVSHNQVTGSGNQFSTGSGSQYPCSGSQCSGPTAPSHTTGSGSYNSGSQFSSGSGNQNSGSGSHGFGSTTQTQTTGSGSQYTNGGSNQNACSGSSCSLPQTQTTGSGSQGGYQPNTGSTTHTGSNQGSVTHTQTTGSGNSYTNGGSSTQYSGSTNPGSLTQTTGYGSYNSGSSGPSGPANSGSTSSGTVHSNSALNAGLPNSLNSNNPIFNEPSGFQSNFASSGFSSNGNRDYTSNSLTSGFVNGPVKGGGGAYGTVNAERGYLPPVADKVPCSGPGKVCALKQQCQNGFISDRQVPSGSSNQNQFCNPDSEVCCKIQVTPQPTPRPTQPLPPQTSYQPKTPTQPPYQPPKPTQPPYQPPKPTPPPYQPQSTPCGQRSQVCVKPDQCQNGIVRPGSPINQQQSVDKCYAPEVCCRIPDAPVPSIKTPTKEYLPQPEPQPDNNNPYYIPPTQRPYVPPVQTQRPYVPPVQTQRPYVPPQTQAPYVPPVQTQRPYVPPVQTQRPYVPPVQTQRPYVPPVQTQRPYVPPVQTQRPYVPPTNKPFQGDQYIPPIQGDSSINNPKKVLPPFKGGNDLSEPIYPGSPTNDRPTILRPNNPNNYNDIPLPPVTCAAALNCTEIQFCTAQGVISKTPVVLTPNQELFRVPLSDCRSLEKGYNGKCCRDPDYVDPWPVTDLGRYRPEIFGGGQYKPSPGGQYKPSPGGQYKPAVRAGVCGQRYLDTLPRGTDDIDANFGEIPWQAMVLSESKKSILCGGTIIGEDTVITSGNCVNGQKPTDVMIKAGEYRLGVDEEPTFQIVRVKQINFQPTFRSRQYDFDVALLHLESKLNWTSHIQPICIEDPHFPAQSADSNCITSGWGKEVIKIHLKDAVMHLTNVTVLPHTECESQYKGYNSKGSFCGKGGHDLCLTDVGSGLACTSGKEQYLLRGVYATETGCNIPNQLGSFAKIDVKWVNAAIADPTLENYQPDIYDPQGNSPQGVKTSFPQQPTKYLPPVY